MPNILFVCTANICRSPMAAAMFEQLIRSKRLPGRWSVASAGTWAQDGHRASENGRQLMASWDLDISKHRSRIVRPALLEAADLILTMEQSHKEALQAEFNAVSDRVFMLSEMVGRQLDIRDPYGGTMLEYRDTAREIAGYLEKGFPRILDLLGPADPGGKDAG